MGKKRTKKGKLKSVKRAVIHRVFASANPEQYSTILSKGGLKKFIVKLNSLFDMKLSTTGNWAELNSRVMDAIKAKGLSNEDNFLINNFAWFLYEKLILVVDPVGRNLVLNKIFYGPPMSFTAARNCRG